MDVEDQYSHDDEMEITAAAASYDSVGRRVKIPSCTEQRKQSNKYRECLKNHAVGVGGHALDGCGEFLPAGADGTLDALKCAACNCHRNFHRKETHNLNAAVEMAEPLFLMFPNLYRSPAGYLPVGPHQRPPLALPSISGGGVGAGKKRFRTKFTQEQKDRMVGLAERLGWRIQKQDEGIVQQFCNDVGVNRHVLKVWMHNNKHTLGMKP